jgi:hypothetical protein
MNILKKNPLYKYILPIVISGIILLFELIPYRSLVSISIGIGFLGVLVAILDMGWITFLERSKAPKAIKLYATMREDAEMWSRRGDFQGLLILLGISNGLSLDPAFLVYFSTAFITSTILYLGYVGGNYDDDFQSPDGFV